MLNIVQVEDKNAGVVEDPCQRNVYTYTQVPRAPFLDPHILHGVSMKVVKISLLLS